MLTDLQPRETGSENLPQLPPASKYYSHRYMYTIYRHKPNKKIRTSPALLLTNLKNVIFVAFDSPYKQQYSVLCIKTMAISVRFSRLRNL